MSVNGFAGWFVAPAAADLRTDNESSSKRLRFSTEGVSGPISGSTVDAEHGVVHIQPRRIAFTPNKNLNQTSWTNASCDSAEAKTDTESATSPQATLASQLFKTGTPSFGGWGSSPACKPGVDDAEFDVSDLFSVPSLAPLPRKSACSSAECTSHRLFPEASPQFLDGTWQSDAVLLLAEVTEPFRGKSMNQCIKHEALFAGMLTESPAFAVLFLD